MKETSAQVLKELEQCPLFHLQLILHQSVPRMQSQTTEPSSRPLLGQKPARLGQIHRLRTADADQIGFETMRDKNPRLRLPEAGSIGRLCLRQPILRRETRAVYRNRTPHYVHRDNPQIQSRIDFLPAW